MLTRFATILCALLGVVAACNCPAQSFEVRVRGFQGDLGEQQFATYTQDGSSGTANAPGLPGGIALAGPKGRSSGITALAESAEANGVPGWKYQVRNLEPGLTVCEVTFTLNELIRLAPQWQGERILWPALYRGAVVDRLADAEGFKDQASRLSIGGNGGSPYLTGLYQQGGRLGLPFFVQENKGRVFSIMVHDPTHEVFRLTGLRRDKGMEYSVTMYPRIPTGGTWSFGDIKVIRDEHSDWHQVADLHRNWLIAQGFRPENPVCEPGVLAYLRWHDFRPDEILKWASRTGTRDVLLWIMLFCGGDWLTRQGGYLPLRVRSVDFKWGEYPCYWWHGRPFYAACVNSDTWRKVMCDSAILHARLGAAGIYIDQTGAIAPEICGATGHGHDRDSFGFWNRGTLELLREIKAAGSAVQPGFFIETEGSSDLYGKYIDRSMGNFRPVEEDRCFSRLFRYTVPWFKGNLGTVDPSDAGGMEGVRALLERTLLLGETFRFAINTNFDGAAPKTAETARLFKAALTARRALAAYYDDGLFMDDQGLKVDGGTGVWFSASVGTLVAIQADQNKAGFSLAGVKNANPARARNLDWQTGTRKPVVCKQQSGTITVSRLSKGLNLVVIP